MPRTLPHVSGGGEHPPRTEVQPATVAAQGSVPVTSGGALAAVAPAEPRLVEAGEGASFDVLGFAGPLDAHALRAVAFSLCERAGDLDEIDALTAQAADLEQQLDATRVRLDRLRALVGR